MSALTPRESSVLDTVLDDVVATIREGIEEDREGWAAVLSRGAATPVTARAARRAAHLDEAAAAVASMMALTLATLAEPAEAAP